MGALLLGLHRWRCSLGFVKCVDMEVMQVSVLAFGFHGFNICFYIFVVATVFGDVSWLNASQPILTTKRRRGRWNKENEM